MNNLFSVRKIKEFEFKDSSADRKLSFCTMTEEVNPVNTEKEEIE